MGKKILLSLGAFALLFATTVYADQMMHSGNVTKIDKATGALTVKTLPDGKEVSFKVADPDILKSTVWKKRLQLGDGVDVKTDGEKVIVVLQRVLPISDGQFQAAHGVAHEGDAKKK